MGVAPDAAVQSRQGPNCKDEVALYDSKMWAYDIAAYHLLSTAKAIEARTKRPKLTPATTLCGPHESRAKRKGRKAK